MALTGERTPHRPHMAMWVLRALLVAALVMAPALQCPAAGGDTAAAITAPGQHSSSAAGIAGVAAGRGVAATAPRADDHHQCALLVAGAAVAVAAISTVHGLAAMPVAAMLLAAAAALWSRGTRSPPLRRSIWFLSSGRERLQHFCVMRR